MLKKLLIVCLLFASMVFSMKFGDWYFVGNFVYSSRSEWTAIGFTHPVYHTTPEPINLAFVIGGGWRGLYLVLFHPSLDLSRYNGAKAVLQYVRGNVEYDVLTIPSIKFASAGCPILGNYATLVSSSSSKYVELESCNYLELIELFDNTLIRIFELGTPQIKIILDGKTYVLRYSRTDFLDLFVFMMFYTGFYSL